jgi:hypothetical protein
VTTTVKKILLPLFLLFLSGMVYAYTPTHPDVAGTTTFTILTFINELIPYWAFFVVAVVMVVIIAILTR